MFGLVYYGCVMVFCIYSLVGNFVHSVARHTC